MPSTITSEWTFTCFWSINCI